MWDAPLLIVVPATKNKYKDFDMAGTPTDKFLLASRVWGISTRHVSPYCNCFNCRKTLPYS